MTQSSQSDAPAMHQDAATTGRGFRHAAQPDDRCGVAQRSAAASAKGYARSQPPCGRTIRGRHPGIFPTGGSHVSAFLWSGESCPRAFINGTADSSKQHRRGGPCHSGRESVGASTASLFPPAPVPKTVVHSRRMELAAGAAYCDTTQGFCQPRVLEASAQHLTIAAVLCSLSRCSSSGTWHKGDVRFLEYTHSFCIAASVCGVKNCAVVAFDARPWPTASTTGSSTLEDFQFHEAKHSAVILTVED
ncbi:uncharacterized protein LOC142574986 isoform X3 [Dermacentor variabilis]|uniref:uncharacterized protein LOC142574986 isoform X3 n=1 Tax=Dermacentor variabilis TaxID=34621 RepID=UPI003F5C9622